MSIHFEHEIDIARAPYEVFAALEDFSLTPKWLASCGGIEILTPGPLAVGTQLRYSFQDTAHSGIMEGQIIARVPNERLAFEYADHLVAAIADFRLSPNAIGTHLVHSIEITPKTFMVKMLAPVIRLQIPGQTTAAMEKLRQHLESTSL